MSSSEVVVPDEEVVRVFWQVARETIGWGSLAALLGQRDVSAVPPPAAALSDTVEEATEIALAIRDGRQTELRLARSEYAPDGSDLPQHGDLLIVCDGRGIPRALVWTSDVFEEDGIVVEKIVTQYPPVVGS